MTILPKKSIQTLTSYRPDTAPLPSRLSEEDKQIRLSVNEGALGASPKAIAALSKLGDVLHRYPEQINRDLVDALAEVFSLNPDMILPANGSDELIGLLATAFLENGDEAIYTQYGFLVFPQAIKIAGGVAVQAADDGLTVSVYNIINAITKKTKLIFLANPNNPTGTMIPKADIEWLIASTPPSVIIVLDSAYAEYIAKDDPEYSAGADYVEANDNVVMLRTFSKIFGLGSLRLGWGYFPPQILSVLASIRGPFSVNTAAATAGIAAVRDHEFFDKSVAHNNACLPRMMASITQSGFEALPSRANFFLIRFANAGLASTAHTFLAGRGILLRKMTPYGLPDCLRMSMGNDAEMAITASAFKDFAEMDKG